MKRETGNEVDVQLSPIPRTPVRQGYAAEQRLHQLGVPGSGFLLDPLADGAAAARSTTRVHPRSYSGQRLWGECVASLRYGLAAHGWEPETIRGIDLVVDRQRGVAIAPTKGDTSTGLPDYVPQVHYDRGEAVQVLVNGALDNLFTAQQRPNRWQVWFLLHNLTRNELTCELSRPIALNNAGWVTGWAERILLPSLEYGDQQRGTVEVNDPPEVDVPVGRRTP